MFLSSALSLSALVAFSHAETLSSGCGGSLVDGQEAGGVHNATVGSRRYAVFLPHEYSTNVPAPLILSYHGGSQTPERQLDLDEFTNPKYNTNKIVIYPAGTSQDDCKDDDSCDKLYWEIDPRIKSDDIQFTKDILQAVEKSLCIDLDRIYASGKSQGGGFVGQLAACDADLSTRVAAFAPVSGAFYIDTDDCSDTTAVEIPCKAGRENIPMIEFHGGLDEVADYGGKPHNGECLPDIQHWVEEWAILDGMSISDVSTSQLSGDTPNTTVTIYGEGIVTHVYASDVAHDWLSQELNDDNKDSAPAEYDATPIILTFFDDHPLTK